VADRQEPASDAPEGDRPQSALSHSLHSRHVSMIAIGGIIGAGLFVGSSTSINAVGPAVIVSYAAAGLVILLVMRMLSEMASLYPGAGSFTELVRIGLGHRAGFVCGWLYWYFWVVVVAIEAIAGAVIVATWVPLPVWLIGTLLLAAMTGVNLLSTRSFGEFEFWFALLKVVAILAFILVAGLWVSGITSPAGPTFENLFVNGGFAPHGWVAIIGGITSVIFALCGAEIATIAAAESREPARTIARITGSVALRILLFYLGSVTLIVCVMPWTEIIPGQSPFAAALAHIGIPAAATVMNLVVLVAVLSCLNSGLYVTSRVLFTLSEKGDAPAGLVAVNARKVPARAILIASLFGYLALAASVLSPELVFSFLVNASGATMLIIYMMVAFAQIAIRRRTEAAAPDRLVIRMWLHPYLSIATIVAIGGVLAAMALQPLHREEFIASAALAAVVGAAAFWRKPRLRAAVA
jgi:GABA permease